MLTYNVNTPSQDRSLVLVSGIASLTEIVTRGPNGQAQSYAQLTFPTTTISGLITTLHVDLWEDAEPASNTVYFTAVPSGYSTLTISGITYTFVPVASGLTAINQIYLGATPWLTAFNLHRVINVLGTAGIDYHAGQTAHPAVYSTFANNPLVFLSKTAGTIGNSIRMTTSDTTAISITYPKFYGGTIAKPITTVLDVECSGVGTFEPIILSYSRHGTIYKGLLSFTNSGVVATDALGSGVYWSAGPTTFTGRTSFSEFVEVSGLTIYDLPNNKIDSSGQINLSWTPMGNNTDTIILNTSAPNVSGLVIQTTRSCTVDELCQDPEYPIFVYSGATAPQRTWPRTIDANGTWYFLGRVKKPQANIQVNPSGVIGVWVGFGNRGTWDTTVSPIRNYNTNFYLL